VGIGVNAATHAVAVNAGSAALCGATGALAATPDAVTTAMRADPRPQLKAIGRILQIEKERLKAAALGGGKPAVVVKRVQDTARSRAPIVSWALDLWLRSSLGAEARESQGKEELPPLQRRIVDGYNSITHGRVPNIVESLRVLRLELTSQVAFGLRTSPVLVVKLLYSSLLVTVCAVLGQFSTLPGARAVKRVVGKRWPKLVDHLAATLEQNLAEVAEVGAAADGGLLESLKNSFEDATGLDIDGDGFVGKPPAPVPQGGLLEDLKNSLEDATGLDIDGDGYVGKPPAPEASVRLGGVRGLLAQMRR